MTHMKPFNSYYLKNNGHSVTITNVGSSDGVIELFSQCSCGWSGVPINGEVPYDSSRQFRKPAHEFVKKYGFETYEACQGYMAVTSKQAYDYAVRECLDHIGYNEKCYQGFENEYKNTLKNFEEKKDYDSGELLQKSITKLVNAKIYRDILHDYSLPKSPEVKQETMKEYKIVSERLNHYPLEGDDE